MASDLKPIRTEADHAGVLAEVERLWGSAIGTPEGDRLDMLATLIDAYEAQNYPMDPPACNRSTSASRVSMSSSCAAPLRRCATRSRR